MDELLSTVGGESYKPKIVKPPEKGAEPTGKAEAPKVAASEKVTRKKRGRNPKGKGIEYTSVRVEKTTNDIFRMICFFEGGNVQDMVNEILKGHIEANKGVYRKILKRSIKI